MSLYGSTTSDVVGKYGPICRRADSRSPASAMNRVSLKLSRTTRAQEAARDGVVLDDEYLDCHVRPTPLSDV